MEDNNTLYFDGKLSFGGSDEPTCAATVERVYETILAKRDNLPADVNTDHGGFDFTATCCGEGVWKLEFADVRADRDEMDVEDIAYEIFYEGTLV